MFKFSLNDVVWYMKNNRIHSAGVLSRKYVDNDRVRSKLIATREQKKFFNRFGTTGKTYATCHGEFDESQLFRSKKELLKNLKNS